MVCFLHLPVWEPIKATLEILLLCNILCFSSLQGEIVSACTLFLNPRSFEMDWQTEMLHPVLLLLTNNTPPHRGSQPITPSNRASLPLLFLSPSDPLSLSVCLSLSLIHTDTDTYTHSHRHRWPYCQQRMHNGEVPGSNFGDACLACFESISEEYK